MGPEKNRELFESVAESRIDSLTQEFVRRNLLAATLKELSDFFAEKDNTPHPVTEPTLLGRLWGLAQVQRGHMGVAGFEPLDAVRYDGAIFAKSAPYHDEFTTQDGNIIRTRIISLNMFEDEYSDDIEIFGINLYQPDANTDEFDEHRTEQDLVIVSGGGKILDKERPVIGETVAFAVRNKKTQDSKLYKVRYLEPTESVGGLGRKIEHQTETKTTVTLPDASSVEVELLNGQLQQQVVEELEAAIRKLSQKEQDNLSSEEKHAVSEIIGVGATQDTIDWA
ncbi:hypothetical protein A3A68_00255 [Candidatus Saccharibacteria bacterium RIFCSPLOWO2_01_FULL_48_13]|nr:MAG: hypothetical protein A2884_01455 [Candidatus Saccharibacteria bacterium RIFCSPHIGHO2_01_FULL_48_12]OGL35944.1 MAG: hypothetical protein A3F38_02505 [Candidatus Saccharibacteria bacterium RIFCSPHIGHO2_12_FULL_48_21]OGL36999.1 MAG: hypothetical protein A3A68_00255 [Candidatus Saccharibacteria bacterium RIFCSPLOWO2_01_FULL_48_13]